MTNTVYLYGRNPLKELLQQIKEKKQPLSIIQKVCMTTDAEEDGKITGLLQSLAYKHERVTRAELDSMIGQGAVHQGVCALIQEHLLYTPLDTVLEKAKNGSTRPLVVLLDELQDPHNVGAIIRSALAFGATAVLMPEHDQVQVTSAVIKSSAGAVFSIPIVHIGNVNTTLRNLKNEGFWIYGLDGNGKSKLHKTTFDADTVIVIGNEGEGIKEKTLELCDFTLAIDIHPGAESLNASNAVAVTLYEWHKQQNS